MSVAQMEEVTPWELYPIPLPVRRSTATLVLGKTEIGERCVFLVFLFFPRRPRPLNIQGTLFFPAEAT